MEDESLEEERRARDELIESLKQKLREKELAIKEITKEAYSDSALVSTYPIQNSLISPDFLLALETDALMAAETLESLMQNLKQQSDTICSLSKQNMQALHSSALSIEDHTTNAIVNMNQLLSNSLRFEKEMKHIRALASQIQELKRILDIFETMLNKRLKAYPK